MHIDNDQATNQSQAVAEQLATAPVIFKGDTLFMISHSPGYYPVAYRADQISQRLETLTKDYKQSVDSLYLKTDNEFITVMYNDQVAFIVTKNDAETILRVNFKIDFE